MEFLLILMCKLIIVVGISLTMLLVATILFWIIEMILYIVEEIKERKKNGRDC